jgi:Flp pilus assembly protein TadG
MTFARISSFCRSRAGRFVERLLRSDMGSVTVEFVIITPLMCLVLTGFAETYMYMRASSTVEHTAFTLADSIGQYSSIGDSNTTDTANNLGALWAAAATLASPNDLKSSGAVFISMICDYRSSTLCYQPSNYSLTDYQNLSKKGTPTLYWQRGAPWNASGLSSQITSTSMLPTTWPFRAADTAIVVEVFYSYDPWGEVRAFWSAAPGKQTLYQRIYVRPRSSYPLCLDSFPNCYAS